MKISLLSKTLLVSLIAVTSLVFLGASCYKSSSTNSNTTPVATNQITINNFAFNPSAITVSKGTEVTWTNNDSTTHTVTSNDNKFSSGNLSPAGQFKFTFNDSGTFSYHCSIHSSMTGQVIVK